MNIVLATDLSEGSKSAARWSFDYAGALDRMGLDVELTVLHTIQTRYPQLLDESVRLQDAENRQRIHDLVEDWLDDLLPEEQVDYATELVAGNPDEALKEYAEEHDSDWLAVGMTGRGALQKLIIGSTSEQLAHGPPCNLAICHPDHNRIGDDARLVCGVDFTDASAAGLKMAAQLANQTDAHLELVHVVEPPTYEAYPYDRFDEGEVRDMGHLVEMMTKELADFIDEHDRALEGVDWESRVLTGYPTQELVQFADQEGVDGICMGTVGRSTVADFLMGSVSRGVVKHMPCSVFLAPPVDERL